MKYEIYTDGACKGNNLPGGGPGGFGLIVLVDDKIVRKECRAFSNTTNNRMELMAVIESLTDLPNGAEVTVTTDSKYVVDSVTKGWLDGWLKKADFAGKKNEDLWKKFQVQRLRTKKLDFKWVKGHADNKFNNACDTLANRAIMELEPEEDVR